MHTETIISETPKTIGEVKDFLAACIQKVVYLNACDFGRFTVQSLPADYFYNKWLNNDKDFIHVYLNMDGDNKEGFIRHVLGKESEQLFELSLILKEFFMFCHNWHEEKYLENPFRGGKHAAYLSKKVKAGKENSGTISSMQVLNLFHNENDKYKIYLTWCVFGKKEN